MTRVLAVITACLALAAAQTADAQVMLKSIVHVKGQEKNTLNGIGLAIGLKGTGDGSSILPTIRSLATIMESMRMPLGTTGLAELKDAKNVAIVMVTAVVPAGGVRQGQEIDCFVSSIGGAKSLAGGVLFSTPLMGPAIESEEVFGVAEGRIALDDAQSLTTGRIHGGCRMEQDVRNEFVKDGALTLVLDEHHADFMLASEIAKVINDNRRVETEGEEIARALDQVNVEVRIPANEAGYETEFIGEILELPAPEATVRPKVVINRRSGAITIGGEVEIGPLVVTHKGIQVDAAAGLETDRFAAVDSGDDPNKKRAARLKDLVDALQAVKVPTEDLISIIEGIEKNGKLYGQLVIE